MAETTPHLLTAMRKSLLGSVHTLTKNMNTHIDWELDTLVDELRHTTSQKELDVKMGMIRKNVKRAATEAIHELLGVMEKECGRMSKVVQALCDGDDASDNASMRVDSPQTDISTKNVLDRVSEQLSASVQRFPLCDMRLYCKNSKQCCADRNTSSALTKFDGIVRNVSSLYDMVSTAQDMSDYITLSFEREGLRWSQCCSKDNRIWMKAMFGPSTWRAYNLKGGACRVRLEAAQFESMLGMCEMSSVSALHIAIDYEQRMMLCETEFKEPSTPPLTWMIRVRGYEEAKQWEEPKDYGIEVVMKDQQWQDLLAAADAVSSECYIGLQSSQQGWCIQVSSAPEMDATQGTVRFASECVIDGDLLSDWKPNEGRHLFDVQTLLQMSAIAGDEHLRVKVCPHAMKLTFCVCCCFDAQIGHEREKPLRLSYEWDNHNCWAAWIWPKHVRDFAVHVEHHSL